MLVIEVEEQEYFNHETGMFFYTKPYTVKLEHSLISLSKWEAFWKKPYLQSRLFPGISGRKEELHYIGCMVIGPDPPSYILDALYNNYKEKIMEYIADPHSATSKHTIGKTIKQSGGTVTAEIIYYWMIQFSVPFECEKWHLNRLFNLLEVCVTKSKSKNNKLSPREAAEWRHRLNEERKRQWASP